MENGYKLLWTDHALIDLSDILEYLENKWTEKEIRNFARKLDNTLQLIISNPFIFQKSDTINIRRAVVTKHNTLYYRIDKDIIQIISVFSNFQNPQKRR